MTKHPRLIVQLGAAFTTGVAAMGHAQIPLPPVELRGLGESQLLVVHSANCIGADQRRGRPDGRTWSNNWSGYFPALPTTTNPELDCNPSALPDSDTRVIVQSGFSAKYIATGSEFARKEWSYLSNQFDGTAGKIFPTEWDVNPGALGIQSWPNVHFAFSLAAVTDRDLTSYNGLARGTLGDHDSNPATPNTFNKAGNAIQVPLFILPIAIAYDPKYGVKSSGSGPVDLTYNVKTPIKSGTTVVGGLRLSKIAYCKIFNGEITNFNHAMLATLNGNQSLRDLDDPVFRWDNEGVPIRLVGRLDNAGTSDIFTRALAAQCDAHVAVNKFDQAAEALPYNHHTAIFDLTIFRSDTPYTNNAADPDFTDVAAGTVTALSGAVYAPNHPHDSELWGVEFLGLFAVADGDWGVEEAIKLAPDKMSELDPTIKLNGKLGYLGADHVMPAPGQTLHSAGLQEGNATPVATTKYLAPIPANAIKAFGTGATAILPPQSTSTGVYNIPGETRISPSTGQPLNRAEPRDWHNALYAASGASNLANPNVGYPLTGTLLYFGYTCYANSATRFGIAELLGLLTGKVVKDENNAPISANTFKGAAANGLGVPARSNLPIVPQAWQQAITETFLKKSIEDGDPSAGVQKLGDLNLWIQDKPPTAASHVDDIPHVTDPQNNPRCTDGVGA